MAVIKYSGLVDQLRGRLNGTVFSKFHDGFSSYKKGQPKQGGSEAQLLRRKDMQKASQLWGNLTPPQRQAWAYIAANTPVTNRLGDSVHLPAFQYFVKYAMYEYLMDFPPNENPSNALTDPYTYGIQVLNFEATQENNRYLITDLSLRFTIAVTSIERTYAPVYISYPISRQDSNYDNTWFFVGYSNRAGGNTVSQTFTKIFTDVLMPAGWYTAPGAYHAIKVLPLTLTTAQEGISTSVNYPVDYTPAPNPVWELDILPTFDDDRECEFSGSSGGYLTISDSYLTLGTNPPVSNPASQYNAEIQFSEQVSASSVPNPSSISGSEYLHSAQVANVFTLPEGNFNPISNFNLTALFNNQWLWPDISGQRNRTFRIRMQNISSSEWTDWYYFNYRALPS